jgi:hypothetical protein
MPGAGVIDLMALLSCGVCMSGINWAIELPKIEREFSGLPAGPSPGAVNARRAAERRAQQRHDAVGAALGAAARLLLVVALASALSMWPYARECGMGLFFYMGAEVVIMAGALWAVAYTWRYRLVRMHTIAIVLAFCGLALISAQVLPRIGYARADPARPAHWRCVAAVRG